MNKRLFELAKRYADELKRTLGENLVSVILFGSVARGEADRQSDIDIFIVLEKAPKGMLKRRKLLEPARQNLTKELEKLWQEDIFTDFVEIIRTKDEALRFHPVYLDMIENGIVLYDRGEFMLEVLKKVAIQLKKLGAKKVKVGKVWHWDLKPDYRIGEVIKI